MAVRLLVHRFFGSLLILALAGAAVAAAVSPQDPARHDVTVTGRDYTFSPSRIVVASGDIVRITLVADDTPCSFTVDAYRISKRAAPGHPVTFEFRADRPGTFPYYCDLTTDERCKGMRGELVVEGPSLLCQNPGAPSLIASPVRICTSGSLM